MNGKFLYRHRFLHMIWQGFPEFFPTLSFAQQRAVHDYYRPSKELTDEQLLEHRAKVTKVDPMLPPRAVRRLEEIYKLTFAQAKGDSELWRAILNQHRHVTIGKPDKKGRRLAISAIARDDLDTRMIARTLYHSVLDDQRGERSSTPADTNTDRTESFDTPSSAATDLSDEQWPPSPQSGSSASKRS